MTLISVVIPVYKAADCLQELYDRLTSSLQKITQQYEIILVEDCGGDDSWKRIQELAKVDPRVVGIQFSRNFGQHYGITAGLDYCHGDWAIVMDCDLQDRPEEIPRLFEKAQEGFDIVLAKRGARKDPTIKRLTSWFYYKIFAYLADIEYDGDVGNFRIISRNVIDNYRLMRERLRFFGGLVAWMGFSSTAIEVQHDQRFAGTTSYTFRRLLKLAFETIIAYSDKPLRISIRFGFLISFLAFIYGIYIVYKALVLGIPVAGWGSLIASIYFLGGIIICILGIMGVYLGKVFEEAKRRPLYIISRVTSNYALK
jgi:dolichol-phosphate mannosyltransferase